MRFKGFGVLPQQCRQIAFVYTFALLARTKTKGKAKVQTNLNIERKDTKMSINAMDRLSELEITLKQAKAVLNGFSNDFTGSDKKTVTLAVETQFENYTYSLSVVSDLLYKAIKQVQEAQEKGDNEE